MNSRSTSLVAIVAGAAVLLAACGQSAPTAADQIKRGEYLVAVGACGDCHTPGAMLGQIEMDKKFAGGSVGFQMPDGTFFPPNLTPDDKTGLGKWSEEQIATAVRTGARPDGRILSEVMPYKHWYSQLTEDDALAVAKYLKSLSPVSNKVPGPFGQGEAPTGPYMATVMPGNRSQPAAGGQPQAPGAPQPAPSQPTTPPQ
jgi:mono/diheme cytochrome c family protein